MHKTQFTIFNGWVSFCWVMLVPSSGSTNYWITTPLPYFQAITLPKNGWLIKKRNGNHWKMYFLFHLTFFSFFCVLTICWWSRLKVPFAFWLIWIASDKIKTPFFRICVHFWNFIFMSEWLFSLPIFPILNIIIKSCKMPTQKTVIHNCKRLTIQCLWVDTHKTCIACIIKRELAENHRSLHWIFEIDLTHSSIISNIL